MVRNIVLVLSLLVGTGTSFAKKASSDPHMISQHGDWSVYKVDQGKDTVYYALTYPKQSKGKYSKRGDVYILITSRPKEGSYNVFSFHAGYPFKDGATVKITIDNKKSFTAFANGETCWVPDDLDNQIADAFSKGKTVTIEGESARGTKTVDTFSLAGSGLAFKDLSKISRKG